MRMGKVCNMEKILSVLENIKGYLPLIRLADLLDVAIVAYLVYKLLSLVKSTRAANILKGVAIFLAALWLFYMAVAGLSLTTDVFERNLVKARRVLFVSMTLGLSSAFTLIANILTGRYTPEFLETMHLYGFSALRFNVVETSVPDFGVQSLWAVAAAAASFSPKFAKAFLAAAAVMTVAVVFAAKCFISDAVTGAYVGVIAYYAAAWIKSENRENTPLISL